MRREVRAPRRLRATIVLFALCLAGSAQAACTLPVAPDPATRPARPAAPVKGPCVDAKSGAPGCLGWEGYRYNDEVKAYNEKAKTFQAAATAYVAKLNAYVQASSDYARCEVALLQ